MFFFLVKYWMKHWTQTLKHWWTQSFYSCNKLLKQVNKHVNNTCQLTVTSLWQPPSRKEAEIRLKTFYSPTVIGSNWSFRSRKWASWGRTGRGGVSEEGIAPLPQTLSAGTGLTGVCSAGVFEPLGEHLSVFLQQQELTKHHVGLKTHKNMWTIH